jgi:hypothetical protein
VDWIKIWNRVEDGQEFARRIDDVEVSFIFDKVQKGFFGDIVAIKCCL